MDVDGLARRVIAGEFGNGDARKAALGSSYSAQQRRVNEMLSQEWAGGFGCRPFLYTFGVLGQCRTDWWPNAEAVSAAYNGEAKQKRFAGYVIDEPRRELG